VLTALPADITVRVRIVSLTLALILLAYCARLHSCLLTPAVVHTCFGIVRACTPACPLA
jgi:hypothetical protein